MILTNNLTPDSACRTFLSNDISFVSFSNAILFDGKQVIHPERLVRYENDMSLIIDDTKSAEDKKRRRDIVVKTDINGVYCLLSIEHQSTIDKNMVIRCGNYEMMEYLKQLKNKKIKGLVPQVMIVFYTGDKKWNALVKLSNYFDIPEELKAYLPQGEVQFTFENSEEFEKAILLMKDYKVSITPEEYSIIVFTDGKADTLSKIFYMLYTSEISIQNFKELAPTLEDVFLSMIEESEGKSNEVKD